MTLPIRYTRRENVFVWARRRARGEDGRTNRRGRDRG